MTRRVDPAFEEAIRERLRREQRVRFKTDVPLPPPARRLTPTGVALGVVLEQAREVGADPAPLPTAPAADEDAPQAAPLEQWQ